MSSESLELPSKQYPDKLEKYPLLKEEYAALECPACNTLCFPQTKYPNGTVRYTMHLCPFYEGDPNPRRSSFSILEDGSLKGWR
jgi:hypothetical protein